MGERRVYGGCVACTNEKQNARRAANPEAVKKHAAKWNEKVKTSPELLIRKRTADAKYRATNSEAVKLQISAWRARNKPKLSQYVKKSRSKNPSSVATNAAKRRASKLLRTPKWLTDDDHWMIAQAYEIAALRSKLFGFAWHVDHVLPLQGKIVSGLHTPYNLQVIPWDANVRKGNRIQVN